MSVKNVILLLLARMLKLFLNPLKKKRSSILFVSTTALGDTLWATPTIRALKAHDPNKSLSILTSRIGASVLKNNPHLDKIFVYTGLLSLVRLFKKLSRENFETILFLHTSQRIILPFCSLLGAKNLIGNEGMNKGLDVLLTHKITPKNEHEIQRRLRLLSPLKIENSETSLEFFQDTSPNDEVQQFLKDNHLLDGKKIIGLHAGANDPFKQWPKENFSLLAKRLMEEGFHVIFTGNKDEKKLLIELQAKAIGSIITNPALSLSSFASLLKKFSLFITNDTGPMHLAFALKVPTLALFTPTDSKSCGPLDINFAKVIQKERTCSPCLRKKCYSPFCMQQIGIDEVLKSAKNLLSENKST